MSEHDQASEHADLIAQLNEIVNTKESRDVGIVEFQEKMLTQAEYLTERYSDETLKDYTELKDIEQALSDEWYFSGAYARVTGRIYLFGDTDEGSTPDVWGEPSIDDLGAEFYFVEDEILLSQGVEVGFGYDDEGELVSARPGFIFSLDHDGVVDEEDAVPLFILYPGDEIRHEYDTFSPQETELRLGEKWPSEFDIIKQLVRPDLHMALPARIQTIQERLQDALVSSSEFRRLLSSYFETNLQLNQEFPYVVTATQSVYCYEGVGDAFSDDPEGTWTKLSLKEPLSVLLYQPVVRMFGSSDERIRLNVSGHVYNEGSQNTKEYVRFDLESIDHFRGTLATHSILDRVVTMMGAGESTQYLEDLTSRQGDVILSEGGLMPDDAPVLLASVQMQEMMTMESELLRVKDEVVEAQKIMYASEQEALAAAQSLIANTLKSMLYPAGLESGFLYTVEGGSILLPNRAGVSNDLDEKPNVFIYAVVDDTTSKVLEEGDELTGRITSIVPSIKSAHLNGEQIGFVVSPSLLVSLPEESKTLLSVDGAPMVVASVSTSALVPLDGTASIKMEQLELYKKASDAIYRSQREYGELTTETLVRLRKELSNEVVDGHLQLKDITLFQAIQSQYAEALQNDKSPFLMIDALDGLFVNMNVRVAGDSYMLQSVNGAVEEVFVAQNKVYGNVVDIINDELKGGIVMVINIAPGVHAWVPFTSITDFRF